MPVGKKAHTTKPKRRVADDEDDEEEKFVRSKKKKTVQGWVGFEKKQEESQAANEAKEDRKNRPYEFRLKAGESAQIQFLDDEPYNFDGHNIKDKWGNFIFEPCQLVSQRHCLMCRDGIKPGWKGAFKILDYRGSWDKTKNKGKGGFKYDGPVEKMWLVTMTVLGQLKTYSEKKKKNLSEMVIEVSRTGAGKNDTAYNFDRAMDDDDELMQPIDWDIVYPPVKKVLLPKEDEALVALGFEVPDYD